MEESFVDSDALLRLIYEGHERVDVEYKRDTPWDGDFRCKVVKAVLAIANCGGGYLIIGVDDSQVDSEKKFTGVEKGICDTYDVTDVSQFVNEYCEPAIDLKLHKIVDPTSNVVFVVIWVPSHREVPHICKRDLNDSQNNHILRRGALYYRGANKTSEEIKNADDFRKLIRRCVLMDRAGLRTDFEHVLEGLRSGQMSRDKPPGTIHVFSRMQEYSVIASKLMPEADKDAVCRDIIFGPPESWSAADPDSAREALTEACWDYRGWPYIFYLPQSNVPPKHSNDSIWAYSDKPFSKHRNFDYWRFNYAEGVLYSKNLSFEASINRPEIFDPSIQVNLLAEALLAAGRLFETLRVALPTQIPVGISFGPFDGVRVGSTNDVRFRIYPSDIYGDSLVTFSGAYNVAVLLNRAPELAGDITWQLINKMGYRYPSLHPKLVESAKKFLWNGRKVPQH